MERVGSITGTLFFMEVIVLDEGFYPILLHEPVIFLPNRNRSLPRRYSVNGYSGTGKSGKKGMRVSVSVGLGNRRKSVINWFSVPICRLYPGLVCPFFMASSFMRMNVAPGSVLE